MENQKVQLGNGTLDLLSHILCDPDGHEVRLTQKSAQVLHLLNSNEGSVVTHQVLIDSVWEGNYYIGPKRLNDEIWKIRNCFKQTQGLGLELKTCHRKGYMLAHLENVRAPGLEELAGTSGPSEVGWHPGVKPVVEASASAIGRRYTSINPGARKTLTLLPLFVLLISSNPVANQELSSGNNTLSNNLSTNPSEAVEFFVQLFRTESRKANRDQNLALLQMVATAESSLANFEGSPQTKARLWEGLARMHLSLGNASEAELAINSALDIKRLLYSPQSQELLNTQLIQANIFWISSRFDEANQVYTMVLANTRDIPALSLEKARAHFGLGACNWYLEKNVESEQHLLAALAGFQQLGVESNPFLAKTLEYLGQLNERLGRFPESEKQYEKSYEIVQQVFGEESIRMAVLLTKHAHMMITSGRSEQAVELLNRAAGIYAGFKNVEHMGLGVVNGNLADAYLRLNQTGLAKSHALKAVEILIRSGGPRQPLLAYAFATLGDVNTSLGLSSEAEVNYIKSYIVFSRSYGPDHPETLQASRRLPAKDINVQAGQVDKVG